MKQVVERFKLNDWLGTETAKRQLLMAGHRGQHAETAFLFFRLVIPLGPSRGSAVGLILRDRPDRSGDLLRSFAETARRQERDHGHRRERSAPNP
jgi:hypothetical protein